MTLANSLDPRGWLETRSHGPMRPGSVLLHSPAHVFQAPGGGENQLVQTGRGLETLGLAVRPFSPWTDSLGNARLLHLFGMSREGLELARVAHAVNIPVVLSPICWYEPRALLALAGSPLQAVRGLAGWAWKRAVPRWPSWRGELLGLADAVLPNSRAEARQLLALFGIDRHKVHVVPNGVDPRFADATPDEFRDWFGAGDFVLYVGRVEPRKNVHGLVEACRTLGRHLVVIGDPPPDRRPYLDACRKAGGTGMTWRTGLPHSSSGLASAFATARVFALPSWFETPGLAALEAALAGRAVVVTPNGCAREYFGDRVRYARPDRPREVALAIETAWRDGADPGLAAHVAAHFLWSAVARRTAEVYDRIAR